MTDTLKTLESLIAEEQRQRDTRPGYHNSEAAHGMQISINKARKARINSLSEYKDGDVLFDLNDAAPAEIFERIMARLSNATDYARVWEDKVTFVTPSGTVGNWLVWINYNIRATRPMALIVSEIEVALTCLPEGTDSLTMDHSLTPSKSATACLYIDGKTYDFKARCMPLAILGAIIKHAYKTTGFRDPWEYDDTAPTPEVARKPPPVALPSLPVPFPQGPMTPAQPAPPPSLPALVALPKP